MKEMHSALTARRWPLRAAAAAALASALLVLFAPAASAHATLESSDPADGTVVAKAPKQVTLTYDEGVSVTVGSVRVFDHTGKRVDAGDSHRAGPKQVVVGLKSGLGKGTYLVAWRAVSADSHPVHGGFVFSVGNRSSLDRGVDQSLLGGGGDTAWQVAGAALRIVGYGGLLVAIGGAVFLAAVDEAAGPTRSKVVRYAGLFGVAAFVLDVPVSAELATGLGLSSVTNLNVLRQVLGDGVAASLVLYGSGAAALVWSTTRQRRPARRVVGAGVGAIAVGFAISGHSTTTRPVWLAMLSDGVHSAAGGVWLGGLVLLAISLRGARTADDPVAAARAVSRFSATATWALVSVSGLGLVLAYLEVRALSALTGTTYGLVLLAKVAAVGGVALLGAYNRYRFVPAIIGSASTEEPRSAATRPVWKRFGRIIRLEALGLLAVVALTGVLVNLVPARTAAGIGQVFSATSPMGNRSVNLVIDPAQRGSDVLHVYLLDKLGRPLDDVSTMGVELSLPSKGVGPIERSLFKAAPGHFQANALQIPVSGQWQVVVVARIDKFTEDRATFSAAIH